MVAMLSPELRDRIELSGLRLQEWAVQGAVRPGAAPSDSPLAVLGSVTWDDARLFGVEAEPGSLSAGWNGDEVQFAAHEVTVSGGKLGTLPKIVLEPSATLVTEPGPVLIDVAFTEQQCRGWMRFLSPLVANATSADGTFTLTVNAGRMELKDPNGADISGALQVHSARIGPGPLASQMIGIAATITQMATQRAPEWAEREVWLTLPAQQVPFHVRDGRVLHEGLTVEIGDLAMTSRGFVGLDESLDVELEIPIPDAWLERSPVLSNLRGEVIRIRIAGTLDRPKIDRRALAEFGKRLGARAAGGLLQNLLERQLEKAAEKAARRRKDASAP
jgi:hypothetical protein